MISDFWFVADIYLIRINTLICKYMDIENEDTEQLVPPIPNQLYIEY